MKRLLWLFLVLVLIFTASACKSTNNSEEHELSELSGLLALSDEELIAFLKDSGVEIPATYENEMDCVPFVRKLIKEIETNTERIALIREPEIFKFAIAIKMAVEEFYSESGT